MKRLTALERAIAALENDRTVLDKAIGKLKDQQDRDRDPEPKRNQKPKRLVGSDERAS